jgi:hypothetical protein
MAGNLHELLARLATSSCRPHQRLQEKPNKFPFLPDSRTRGRRFRPSPDRRSHVTIAMQPMRAGAAANVFFNQAKKERCTFL